MLVRAQGRHEEPVRSLEAHLKSMSAVLLESLLDDGKLAKDSQNELPCSAGSISDMLAGRQAQFAFPFILRVSG